MASACWCEVLLGAACFKDEAGALRETPDEDAGACGGSACCFSPRSQGHAPLEFRG